MLRPKGVFKFAYRSRRAVRQVAFEKNQIVHGESELYIPYEHAYHRLTGQYLNMDEVAQTFRGYAARAEMVYQKNNPGYEVIIDRQARKITKKCQEYLHERRLRYSRAREK